MFPVEKSIRDWCNQFKNEWINDITYFDELRVRISLKPVTHSARKLSPKRGQCCHLAERSDAGFLFYSFSSDSVN